MDDDILGVTLLQSKSSASANVYLCGAKLDPSWWTQRGERRVGSGMRQGRIKAIIPLWAPPSRALLSPVAAFLAWVKWDSPASLSPGCVDARSPTPGTDITWCTWCGLGVMTASHSLLRPRLSLYSGLTRTGSCISCHLGSCRGGCHQSIRIFTPDCKYKNCNSLLIDNWKRASLQYLEFIILEFPAVSGFVNSCDHPLRFAGYYHGILLLLLSPMGGPGDDQPYWPQRHSSPWRGEPALLTPRPSPHRRRHGLLKNVTFRAAQSRATREMVKTWTVKLAIRRVFLQEPPKSVLAAIIDIKETLLVTIPRG